MSHTLNDLNNDARTSDNGNGRLIGYTDERGNAWGYAADKQGDESNHYPGAIPVADVMRRLFFWDPVEASLTVTLPDLITPDGVTSGQTFTDPTRKVIVRPDRGTVLHVPSSKYTVHPYGETLIQGLSHIIGDTLNVAGAGILNGGGRAWVQLEAADTVTNDRTGVSFRPHIMAASSHDGTLPVFFGKGTTVIVCSNTFSAALSEAWREGVKVRHTRHSALNLMTARQALGVVETMADETDKALSALVEHTVSDKEWSKFLDLWAPIKPEASPRSRSTAERKREELTGLYRGDERCAPWQGTAWGVVQTVNTYSAHVAQVRDGQGGLGVARFDRQVSGLIDGTTDKETRATLDLLSRVTPRARRAALTV